MHYLKGKIRIILLMMVMSIFITLFGMSEVKGYYQKSLSKNTSFTTASYSALTLSLDKTSYPSGNNTSTVLLTVTNPNSYAVSYTLSFSNTNATYTIDGSASATYVVSGTSNKTNTIAINGATGTSITITVNTVLPYSASKTIVASFDNVNPTVEVTTTNNATSSQTATLKCSDNVGVTAYYWGTTEPTSVSNITTTTTADLNSLKSASGLAKTVSGAGTYWLECRDAAGNFSKTSIVYQKVTLSMSNGTVSSSSIVAKSGNSVALPTPTANNGYTNAGYWYSSNAYSTSVGAYGANYTVSSTTTIYSRATDVTAPTVSFNPNTSSSYAKAASVTVTVADAGSKVKANQTIKYRWQTGTTCSTTASDYTSSATLSNTSAAAETATATVPASGLTGTYYLCVYSGIQDVAGNNSVITKSGSFLFDNTAPSSCSWGNWSTSYIKSGGTATITLTCADANSGIAMDLATSDVTVSGTNLGSVTAVSKGGSNASRTYTFTLTGGSASGTPTLTIAANKIQDVAGNKFATAKTSGSIIVDVAAPTLAVSVSNGTTYAKSKTATVTIADTGGSGLAATAQTIRYVWSTSNVTTCNSTSMPNTISITPTAGSNSATGTITIDSGTGTGKLYICNSSAISDRASNSLAASTIKSADMYLDNTAPSSCSWGNWNSSYIKSGATATITLTCADANSGITMDLATSDVTVSGTNLGTVTNVTKGGSNTSRTYTFTLTGGSASGTPTLTIAANKVQDVAGNKFATAKTSGAITVDVAAPTLAVSVSNGTTYAKSKTATVTIADTGGSGLAATDQTIRYVWSTSNVTTCNSTSMPNTISITPTAGASSATGTITIESGTGAGKLYICNAAAISDRASNSLAASQIKSADMYLDNTAPSSCTWGNWSTSYIKSGGTATITLTCADANSGITMDLATSDVTVSGTNLGSVTAVSKGGSNASRTYTFTLTGGSASGTPTLTIAANKVQDVAGNKFATAKTSGSIIVDVAAPTLAVSVSNGTTYAKSKTATVTIADTGGSGLAATAQTIRYVWSTSNVTTCNSTSMPNTISITPTAGASSATGTITIDSGTGAGKLYICNAAAISDRASNSLAASTIKSADMYLDNTAPSSCNWGNWSTSYIKSGGTATITLTCADANSGITMDLATSDVTVSGTNLGTITNVTKGGSNTSRTYTFTLTGGSASGTPTLTIAANKVQDVAGNKFATAKTSGSIIVDVAAPTLAVSVSSGTTYAKSKTATVTISDTGGSGLAATAQTIRYVWSTSSVTACNSTSMPNTISITPTAGASSATGTITIDSGTGAGSIYICNAAAISDRASNSLAASTIKSASMYLDNTAPSSCSWGSWSASYIKSGGTATITLTCADANSGITMDLAASDVTVSGTNLGTVTNVTKGGSNASRTYTFTLTGGSASGTPTLTIAANKVQDVAGNKFATAKTSGAITVDVTAPSCSWGTAPTINVGNTGTIDLTCTDTGSGLATSSLSASSFTLSNSNASITNVSASNVTNGKKFTVTLSATTGGTTSITLKANTVKDNADNSSNTPSATITERGLYTLSFNANGGSGTTASVSCMVTSGTTCSVTLPANGFTPPTNQGFVGWGTSTSATTGDKPGTSVTLSGDATRYAVWGATATLVTGKQFNSKLKTLSAGSGTKAYTTTDTLITSIVRSDTLSITPATKNIISESSSPTPAYAWYSGGTIYYYSAAPILYMNADSSYMFYRMHAVTTMDLDGLDASKVTTMEQTFSYTGYAASTFNLDLSGWDCSSVTTMYQMFRSTGYSASTFTLNLSGWNMHGVGSTQDMFDGTAKTATTFSLIGLSNWDVSTITNMRNMFGSLASAATSFVLDLSSWRTSSATDIAALFSGAGYDATTWSVGDLSAWDTSNVTTMYHVFGDAGINATTFNVGNIGNWNTSKVTDMSNMFENSGMASTTWYIGNLSNWDTSKVTNMAMMFSSAGRNAATWNIGNLSGWDTSKVTDMQRMFQNAGQYSTTWNGIGTLKVYATTITYMFAQCPKANGTLNIYSNPSQYNYTFQGAATSGAGIVVNYSRTTTNINYIIATGGSGITKGVQLD